MNLKFKDVGKAALVTVKETGKHALRAGSKAVKLAAAAPVPKSLEWIYGFGFKVGVFLILKAFLAARYLNLSVTGNVIALTQVGIAMVFIILGLIMQQEGVLQRPRQLRKVIWGYGIAALVSIIICSCKVIWSWDFFKQAADSNWFMDVMNSIGKGLGEFFMAVIFWDIDLWTLFCVLLCMLTSTYVWMYDGIDDQMRRVIFTLPFTKAPKQITEGEEAGDELLVEENDEEDAG